MAYTPTNWQTGDTITAEKLNKMEGGIESANAPFVVTLTPTALDYSGEMDKTVAEINAAYEAGRKIVFRMYTSATSAIDIPVQLVADKEDYTYPSFEASVVQIGNNALICARTVITDDGTKNTYETAVYTLAPAT